MPSTYGSDQKTVQPIELDDSVLASIGRLVRAFAEIEELVTLFIGALAKLNQSELVIVLGRAALSRRIEMAVDLAKLDGGQHARKFIESFKSSEFRDMHVCRNAVAHGTLMGVDDDGMLAFLTDKTDSPLGNSSVQLVACYHPKTIKALSEAAANSIEPVAKGIGLQSWLKRYQPQALQPHRKGRIKRGDGAKPKHQS